MEDGFRLRFLKGRAENETCLNEMLAEHSIVAAVNLSGSTSIGFPNYDQPFLAQHTAVLVNQDPLCWTLKGGVRLLVLEMMAETLLKIGGGAPMRHDLQDAATRKNGGVASVFPISNGLFTLAGQLLNPPVHAICLPVWHRAKVLEMAAMTLFAAEEEPDSQKDLTSSLNREKVERAAFLLERDLENPPTLEMLASEVVCGASQLSRLFAQYQDKSMPEFLRQRRMEKAAFLFRTTNQSISEIALAVGYTSFSAFTRAFVREFKATPTLYRQNDVGGLK